MYMYVYVYICVENGMKMIIWVGDMVPAPILTNLFGVPQIGSINPHMVHTSHILN